MISYSRELNIRLKALELLDECSININKPISYYSIFHNVKKFNINYDKRHLAGLLGITLYFSDLDEYFIYTDEAGNKTFERQKLTVAHEIGHIVLDHFSNECNCSSKIKNKLLEREAYIFADELLIPTLGLLNLGLNEAYEVSSHFCVSYEAAQNKLKYFNPNALFYDYIYNMELEYRRKHGFDKKEKWEMGS